MNDRDRSATMLDAEREALLERLRAVDDAIAALTGDTSAASEGGTVISPVVPTRVKPQRVLSDEHRHAVIEGGRRARHSREAAKGLARELLDPAPGLASAPKSPRLVKRGT